MRIQLTSVFVDAQDKALDFYTTTLGFRKKADIPMGEHRWITLVSPEDPDGAEFKRLRAMGVRFTQEPTEMGPVTTAVLDDTCGNLVQIHQMSNAAR